MHQEDNMSLHPIRFLRIMGLLDGISLITLLLISMPLKYFADLPQFVTVNGSVHGGIFMVYFLAIVIVQLRIQWHIGWSLLSVLVAFIPFGNFLLDYRLKKCNQPYIQSHFRNNGSFMPSFSFHFLICSSSCRL